MSNIHYKVLYYLKKEVLFFFKQLKVSDKKYTKVERETAFAVSFP